MAKKATELSDLHIRRLKHHVVISMRLSFT